MGCAAVSRKQSETTSCSRVWWNKTRAWWTKTRVWWNKTRVWWNGTRVCWNTTRVWWNETRVWWNTTRVLGGTRRAFGGTRRAFGGTGQGFGGTILAVLVEQDEGLVDLTRSEELPKVVAGEGGTLVRPHNVRFELVVEPELGSDVGNERLELSLIHI